MVKCGGYEPSGVHPNCHLAKGWNWSAVTFWWYSYGLTGGQEEGTYTKVEWRITYRAGMGISNSTCKQLLDSQYNKIASLLPPQPSQAESIRLVTEAVSQGKDPHSVRYGETLVHICTD